jgi:small basic protein
MFFSILGLLVGLLIGINLTITYSTVFTLYITISILIFINGIFRVLNKEDVVIHKEVLLLTFEVVLSTIIAFLGETLGISLYLAVVLAFGIRIFENSREFIKNIIKY